ncbi:MAG: LysE family transporter [Oceanospirillaceae bacterium]|nr:LysE family transporter [Oceanospirillaceae bacterium]
MVSFIVFAFITSITPGPNNSMLMASGIRFGVKRSLPHLFGINVGFGVMFLFVGSILPVIPMQLFNVLEYLAIGLLIYIALRIATASTDISEVDTGDKPWSFMRAASFQWINPKALMMAFAGATSYGLDTTMAAAIFALTNVVCGVWIFAGASLRKFLVGHPFRTRCLYIASAGLMLASIVA